ncbi:MAG: sulfatase-like hydrolase/transferase [Ferrovibrio sp.]|nr:sulfatase-like hydrolase/transferase [Ferrovibrio sp.]
MYRRWFFASLFGIAALAAAASVWLPGAEPRRNVILLTVESTRFDMVRPEIAPHVFEAAQQALRFQRHRAISAWTAPNAVALLTGLDAYEQGIHAAGDTVPRDRELPLQALNRQGWRVAGLQAFMHIEQFQHLGLLVEPAGAPLPWLAGRVLDRQPFFLWYHYLETHLPYAPDPAFAPDWRKLLPPGDAAAVARIQAVNTQPSIPAGSIDFQASDRAAIVALHEATWRQFDAWFAQFWQFFQASGLARNTILVLTADHGEEHLERGQVGHASTTHRGQLHEEIVRLPLFVWLPPDLSQPPRDLTYPTDHRAVMPSLMAWLGQAKLPAPLLDATQKPWRALTSLAGFAEPDPKQVREFIAARIEGDWKRIERRVDGAVVDAELFHLPDDPGESRNLIMAQPEIAARLALPMQQDFEARRVDRREVATAAAGPAPHWRQPSGSRALRFADIAEGVKLAWSGDPAARYVLEYEAGEGGALSLKGRLDVDGLEKDFGRIDEVYWRNYVLPYGRVRLRVGLSGRDDAWSEWIEMRALP